ncbi:LOW QUALITY PROTEIN: 5-methylcytosine rRNA methyltransferase NSUN4-like [Limulus polyphemus]|uniref:NOL1/NOP2/Sun domain family member 4 n=1 Tax=Limulus polyphemus TaxID=6850 RepID=A0ABM1S311_LIMPO|nr:LOW QUALITY PROTEIN: 5-methylcytosine rRNA methyltransferase NSUN4-like [Limulus polyphemus]
MSFLRICSVSHVLYRSLNNLKQDKVLQRRFSNKFNLKKKDKHWAKLSNKKWSTDLAIQHFDDFYSSIFGKQWPSIRLALLCPHKYFAVINCFSNQEKTENMLFDLGALHLRDVYSSALDISTQNSVIDKSESHSDTVTVYQKEPPNQTVSGEGENQSDISSDDSEVTGYSSQHNESIDSVRYISPNDLMRLAEQDYMPVTKMRHQEEIVNEKEYFDLYQPQMTESFSVKQEKELNFPEHLSAWFFFRGDLSDFPSPKRDSLGLLGYYLMDGASVLPVLALGIKPGDIVADLCAAPGGKALTALLTLLPDKLICNDISESRINRLMEVFKFYVPSMDSWRKRIVIMKSNACDERHTGCYDKVLVDVPCTNDRLSVNKNDNNIFKPTRLKERIELPHKQTNILCAGLKSLKPGGSLVYSTCSLSPIQNDGVVNMALQNMYETTNSQFCVKDLTDTFRPFHNVFRFSFTCKYGQLVVPFLPQNFGPMYICKIERDE